jgi:protein TonB
MLQLAMATTEDSGIDAVRRRRIGLALAVVLAAHAGLLVWALAARDRPVERILEERTIVASLLRNEPEPVAPAVPPMPSVPAPAAANAVPQAAHPPLRSKSVPQPLPHPNQPRSKAALAPSAPSPSRDTAPAPQTAAPPVAAEPTPAAPATNTATSTAESKASASSTPKSVSHVDCNIPKPDYPDISKRRSESGTAIVRFVVGLSGHIETVQLEKSSGYPRLDDAALAAIHAGVCQPYKENGEAVRAAYSQSFVFGLTE